jgi:5,10-methylenetetrahydrofolate reductase
MMLTNCTVTDKDGKVTDYIWDDQKKTMVEGRIEKEIPWSVLHQIADQLKGKLVHITCVDHTGRDYKRIVIEYEEQK